MAPKTPLGPPPQARAGDTWIWKIPDLTDYPNSEGWVLTYELIGQTPGAGDLITITAVFQSSGDDINHWLATVAASVTTDLEATLPHSTYQLIGRMVGSGSFANREETVSEDLFLVLPDPRTAQSGDWVTHAEQTLDILRKALRGVLTSAQQSYSIAGRSVSKIPVDQLHALERAYTDMVGRSRYRQIGVKHAVRFGRVA